MIHAQLWPSTVANPRLAFSFDLMNWAEALLYKCQVAMKDFWAALRYKCSSMMLKVYIHLNQMFRHNNDLCTAKGCLPNFY